MGNALQTLQKKTSTKIPSNARIIRTNKAVLTINDIRIAIVPDKYGSVPPGSDAVTNFKVSISGARLSGRGVLTAPKISLVISTTYKKRSDRKTKSAYGRGTTAQDKLKKKISLRFHESQHGADFLRYMKTHRPPQFGGGQSSMTNAEFKTADTQYKKDVAAYFKRMDKYSLANTDCVGVTIDTHSHSNECSPH